MHTTNDPGNVAEIIRIDPEEIKTVRGDEVIVNRDRVIPLVWLLGTAEKRVALAVDDLIGNQDIVIKSLGSFIGKAEFLQPL